MGETCSAGHLADDGLQHIVLLLDLVAVLLVAHVVPEVLVVVLLKFRLLSDDLLLDGVRVLLEILVGRHDLLLHVGGNLDVVVAARQRQSVGFEDQVALLADLLFLGPGEV